MQHADGSVSGADQSSWASEVEAVYQLTSAAANADKDCIIAIDNKSVGQTFACILAGKLQLPAYGFQRWAEIVPLCRNRNHVYFWIPSHGKREDWRPPESVCGTNVEWRRINSRADFLAGEAAERQSTTYGLKAFALRRLEAKKWAHKALLRGISGSLEIRAGNVCYQRHYADAWTGHFPCD